MTKKIILRLALLAVTVFSVHSCRTEDDVAQNTKEPQNKFAAFSQNGNEKVNYPKAFEYLFNRYYELKDAPVKNRNTAGDSPYTDFRFHSQLMEVDNGDKAMLFPVIKGNKVIGLMIGLLEKEETYLRYYEIAATYDQYSFAVNSFQKLADKYSGVNSRGIVGSGSNTDIPEIIVGPPRGGGGMYFPPYDGGGGCTACPPDQGSPSGECPKYGGCSSNGGSGIVNTPPASTKDPCEKMKEQNSNQTFKNKVSDLDKQEVFNKNQETGLAAAYGPQTNYEPLANTANDNLKFPPGNKYFGYMHTHLDSKPGVVKIFSPADVSTFLTSCVRNAQVKGTMSDAYGMVITSQGNYILKYSGDGNYGIGPNTQANWQSWYETAYERLSQNELANPAIVEKLFTQFLEEKVKLDGLEVYKSDKTTGSTSKLKYDGKDKPVKPIPCP
jgi:hypothetical protein